MDVDATKLVPDLPDSVIEKSLDSLKKKMEKLSPVEKYLGGNVYLGGDKGAGYVILEDKGEIVYFVRHEAVRHNFLPLGRQVLVWRNSKSFTAAGFAKHVFFDYLLPKYKALISDKEQTVYGRAFWQFTLVSAFHKNLNVYFLDRRSTPVRLIHLETPENVKEYESAMWGTDEGHKRTFAVVSSVPIKLKSK